MAKVSVAGADILTRVFLTMDGTVRDYDVLPAPSGSFPIGISGEHTEDAPIPCQQPVIYHATEGNPVTVLDQAGHEENRTILLTISETVVRGQRLMPDATGTGTGMPAAAGSYYGAVAMESGVAGESIRVRPLIGLQA